MKRVLIIDALPLMREALRLVVRSRWPTACIIEAGDQAQAEKACRTSTPIHLAVIDPQLPDTNGLSSLILLRKLLPQTAIVVFSSSRDAQTVASSHLFGATAYAPKSAMMSELATILEQAVEGQAVFTAPQGAPAPEQAVSQKLLDSLSPAQMKVLLNIANGRLNKQVAADMNVTEATIKAHMTAIFRKLRVANRSQAIIAIQPLLRGSALAA